MASQDIIDDYLSGKLIDPCNYDVYELERLKYFLGDEDDEA